ncbi:MAG: response regulator [Paracoccaceae bacterium]
MDRTDALMEQSVSWRLLVVEDQAMIAMLLCDMLDELGHIVVGPAARVEFALALLGAGTIDGAILDANLDGHSSAPVARALERRGLPYLVASGYGDAELRQLGFEGKAIGKPFRQNELALALETVMTSR